MNNTYWEELIVGVNLELVEIGRAILAYAKDGAKQSASTNTGQMSVSYSRVSFAELLRSRERLLILRMDYEKMCGRGRGGLYSRPGF